MNDAELLELCEKATRCVKKIGHVTRTEEAIIFEETALNAIEDIRRGLPRLLREKQEAERWKRAAIEVMTSEGIYAEACIEATAVMLEDQDAALKEPKP